MIMGGPGDPVQLQTLPSVAVFDQTGIQDVIIYVSDQTTPIKNHVCWSQGSNLPEYSWMDA